MAQDNELLRQMMGMHDEEQIRETFVRAPFGYPGGKSKSVKHILPHLPQRRVYCEVFGGSGVILLNRTPSEIDIYNDRYGGVVAFYRCIRDERKMAAMLDWLSHSIASREEFIISKDWEKVEDDVERAARWYYMHQLSFSNLGRNFGRNVKAKFMLGKKLHNNLELFQNIHRRFKDVLVENLDWRCCLRDFDANDTVFYCDPPYYGVPKQYKVHMQPDEHRELLDKIFRCRGFVALSGYGNELYDSYEWDARITWDQVTFLKGLSDTETSHHKNKEKILRQAEEVLWIKKSE